MEQITSFKSFKGGNNMLIILIKAIILFMLCDLVRLTVQKIFNEIWTLHEYEKRLNNIRSIKRRQYLVSKTKKLIEMDRALA